jgi:hypothetical protein
MTGILDFIKKIAIVANLVFVLWILYNGINEGFKASLVEKFSYLALILLLVMNTFLLLRSKKNNKIHD